jgi:hypothetical protein
MLRSYAAAFHRQIRCPSLWRGGASNDSCAKTSSAGERHALAIVRVKCFDFECRAIAHGKKRYTAVCDCAVYVHQENLDLFCAPCKLCGDPFSPFANFLFTLCVF